MEINKQLFENVLSGKLKGKFVFRNIRNIHGVELKPNHTCIEEASKKDFYIIRMPDMLFNVVDSNGKSVYCCVKHKEETENDSNSDVIDFIPEYRTVDLEMLEYCRKDFEFMQTLSKAINNMNTLEIKIPENHEIDWQESAKQEKIVFKNINTKPKSWEEYLYSNNHPNKLWFVNPTYTSTDGIGSTEGDLKNFDLNKSKWCMSAYLPSKELAEAFLAMMQLMSLRQAWIGDWKPDYYMNIAFNWGIEYEPNPGVFSIENHCRTNGGGLTFPTKEIATNFMNCFKDLLEVAKPLI